MSKNKKDENIIYVDIDTWYCTKCDTNIDDTIEEMEMHECGKETA